MTTEFIPVCADSDLSEGEVKAVEIDDHPIAIARYEGKVYAVDDICTHDGGNLGEGDVVKGQIQCPRHGARFDLKTGKVTRMPAVFGISTYEVKVEGGQIFIAVSEH